jgi:hypothetical protein
MAREHTGWELTAEAGLRKDRPGEDGWRLQEAARILGAG